MQLKIDPIEVLKNKIKNKKDFNFNRKGNEIITFLNCYSYFIFRQNSSLYDNFDRIYCDGIIFQKIVSFIGIKTQRKSFDMTSLAPQVFKNAEDSSFSVAIIGSEQVYLDKALEHILAQYPGLKVIETRHGFFSESEEKKKYISKLAAISPDIVIVGMGTPLQDTFLIELKNHGWDGVGYTCGGFIHQTATKGTIYYPYYIDRFNLRWLYRIYDEPKLFKRYALYYPVSIFLFFFDLLKYKIKNNFI